MYPLSGVLLNKRLFSTSSNPLGLTIHTYSVIDVSLLTFSLFLHFWLSPPCKQCTFLLLTFSRLLTEQFIKILFLLLRMRNVETMWKAGLFVNDLSMHDSSRDLVLAGEQQSAELKLALDQVSLLCSMFMVYCSNVVTCGKSYDCCPGTRPGRYAFFRGYKGDFCKSKCRFKLSPHFLIFALLGTWEKQEVGRKLAKVGRWNAKDGRTAVSDDP